MNLGENDDCLLKKNKQGVVCGRNTVKSPSVSLSIYILLSIFKILGAEFRPNLTSFS